MIQNNRVVYDDVGMNMNIMGQYVNICMIYNIFIHY